MPDTSGDDDTPAPLLLFVPGASYRLVEVEHAAVRRVTLLELEARSTSSDRIGSSPLPGDRTRCAYLVREPRIATSPGGSS